MSFNRRTSAALTFPDRKRNDATYRPLAQDVADPKGRTFAFGDKESTSGYLIPLHFFMSQGIDPDKYFSKVLYAKHQAIETQVAAGQLDAGADSNRNRNAMIEQGLFNDKALVNRLQTALAAIGPLLKSQPHLLPPRYTGSVTQDNSFYQPIRDASLAGSAPAH